MGNNVNFKKVGFKFIGILLFIASGLITFLYMQSAVLGVIACFIAGVQALGIESAKSFFSYIALTTPSSHLSKKSIFAILALLAFIISIIATTGFGIQMSYQVQDHILKASDMYKTQQNFIKTQNELFKTTQSQIEDAKSQRDSQLAKMEVVKNAWGKGYKTMKSIEQDKINAAASKYNSDIAAKEQQLQAIASSLNKETGESLKGKGFQGLYIQLAKFINDNRVENPEPKPVIPDDVNFWINFCISICLELFGIGFIYLSMKEEGTLGIPNYYSNANDSSIGFKPSIATAQNIPNNTIVSRNTSQSTNRNIEYMANTNRDYNKLKLPENHTVSDSHEHSKSKPIEQDNNIHNNILENHTASDSHGNLTYSKDDVVKYVNYMYNNLKGNVSKGFRHISNNINVQEESCRKIKGHLERLKVIESVGAKTVVLCTKNEALKKI
jgi:hypothetical protein